MDEWEQYRHDQAKAWLEHVRRLGTGCVASLRAVESERAQLENLKGVDYTVEHVGGTRAQPDVEALVDSIRDNIRHYCAGLKAYADERRDAYDRLEGLEDPRESHALQLRYCMGYPWEYVEGAMSYSHQHMMRIRESGIMHAYDVMPLEWRDPKHPAI